MEPHDDVAEKLEELDIEEFAKTNPPECKKPHARFYRIRIDREKKRVREEGLSGTQILALVGKTPETHTLYQKVRGGKTEVVQPSAVVSFVAPGVERFQTIPKDCTEGSAQ